MAEGGSADRIALVEDDGGVLMWIPGSSPRMTVAEGGSADCTALVEDDGAGLIWILGSSPRMTVPCLDYSGNDSGGEVVAVEEV